MHYTLFEGNLKYFAAVEVYVGLFTEPKSTPECGTKGNPGPSTQAK
jgi:hypothetical protein